MAYLIGNMVRVSVRFRSAVDGSAVDPTTVVCKVKNPSNVEIVYTYGVDAELVKESTGNYHVDIFADMANSTNNWHYRWEGTGQNAAATEDDFAVTASSF